MPEIIRDNQVVQDEWRVLTAQQAEQLDQFQGQPVLVPLEVWNSHHEELQKRANTGLWLASDQLPEQIAGAWAHLPVIAVDFPMFSDGRGFSIARLLRQRHHFTGEIRAIGSLIRDQLSYLVRCGFNAFQLAEHYDLHAALASMKDFSESYQTAVDQETPLFRRRRA